MPQTMGRIESGADGCPNGCPCDACLMQLADDLKHQLNADELRMLVELLTGGVGFQGTFATLPECGQQGADETPES